MIFLQTENILKKSPAILTSMKSLQKNNKEMGTVKSIFPIRKRR